MQVPDSMSLPDVWLEEFEVIAPDASASRREGGTTRIESERLLTSARTFGEPDLLLALKQETAVSSAGDYGSGLSFQGADPYQSIFRVDGAPVFFPYRFGGIFSTFNAAHLGDVRLWRTSFPTDAPSRIGSAVDLQSASPVGRPTFLLANAGLLSSSATLRQPIGRKAGVTLSGRVSYMNLLYKPFLKADGYSLGYDFDDANLALFWNPDSVSSLRLSMFFNSDALKMNERSFALDMALRWHNETLSLNYERTSIGSAFKSTLYISGFGSRLGIDIPGMESLIKASVSSAGGSAGFQRAVGRRWLRDAGLTIGADLYRVSPQWSRIKGLGGIDPGSPAVEEALESRLSADLRFPLGRRLELTATFTGNLYIGPAGYRDFALLPALSFEGGIGKGRLAISAAMSVQSLHQVGFSEIGLASNYWTAATQANHRERSARLAASWDMPLPWLGLSLASDAYLAFVRNMPEYASGILETLNPGFAPSAGLRTAHGWNSGVSLELRRNYGALNGRASVSWSVARRRFDECREWCYGNYDGGLRLGMTIEWHPGRHWVLGSTFNLASGRVYTPVREIYLISAAIATEYGKRNSARLPMYQRLDLSATYVLPFRGGRNRHLLNFSLLNAYGHKNIEMMYYRVDPRTMRYGLKKIYSVYRWLPSLSYTFEMK